MTNKELSEAMLKYDEIVTELTNSNFKRSSHLMKNLSEYLKNTESFYTTERLQVIVSKLDNISDELSKTPKKVKIIDKGESILTDVAGNKIVKDNIRRLIIYPILRPDLFKIMHRNKRGAILMYGVPGTGKTRIARTLSKELNMAFYEIKCSDVLSRYFGETEEKIKDIFNQARKQKSIIFFDEFDAIANKRDSDDNGAANRMVAELLTQIDGFDLNNDNITFIASTNRPESIDSAFLRPGRFDTLIEIPLPDIDTRREIISQELSDSPIEDNINLELIARKLEGYNSSDIASFIDKLKDKAIERTINTNTELTIKETDVDELFKSFKSSVYQNDVDRIARFRNLNC